MFYRIELIVYDRNTGASNTSDNGKHKGGTHHMEGVISILDLILENIVNLMILLFEFIGVSVIIWTGLMSFVKWLNRSHETGIYLAKGLSLGLEFKMGSEILRTVIVRDWEEIGIVAGIIVLRALLAFILHWEIREEEKEIHKNTEGE